MSYLLPMLAGMVVPAGTAAIGEETCSAATAVNGEYLVGVNCKIKRIAFYVSLAFVADTAAAVLTFRKRTSYGTSAGQSTIGTLTIPDLATLGSVYYKDVTPVQLAPGNTICCDHTTQVTSAGSAAGKGFYMFELELDPEVAANCANMVASA